MHCKDCKFWKRENVTGNPMFYGDCNNTNFVDTNISKIPNDGLGTYDHEGYMSGFSTGENFGCIHFEDKNVKGD